MFIWLFVITIIICFIDLPKLIQAKKHSDAAVFLIVVFIVIAYGYYFSTHLYTTSISGRLIKLLGMQE